MSQQLDTQGEAHAALGTAVSSYGQRVLNDPHILGNLVTDLLPDLPRERSLLVTGADAGIAAQMTQYVEEQHIDPDTAVQLVARALSERRAIDQAASMWVVTEYAQALGYRIRPYAEAAQSTQPQVIAAAPSTMTAPSGQPAQPPGQSWPPGAQAPQAPPGQSWPPGQPPGQSWPPAQPPSGRPPTPGNGRKRGLIAAGTAAGLVVIFFIVAAVAGIAPFSKAHPKPSVAPSNKTTTHPPTRPATSPPAAPTLAAGVTPLAQLLPGDISDPTTQCSAIKKTGWSSPGMVTALSCDDKYLPNGAVSGYQMDNRADFDKAWSNFNSWSSFDESTAGASCPASSTGGQGLTSWSSKHFPSMQGQVLECWTGSNAAPIYVWTMPSQYTFFIAVGADGSSFQDLDTWWADYSAPANPPTATPSPQTS
ncbi:MAG TPA: hypothetical protein VE979_01075 [Streptosporangiaceae bacterium]|nr:hypothetical protein [Streptosporangiaceae bacterium]